MALAAFCCWPIVLLKLWPFGDAKWYRTRLIMIAGAFGGDHSERTRQVTSPATKGARVHPGKAWTCTQLAEAGDIAATM
eukprot:5576565-Amphidinium_carterae.1